MRADLFSEQSIVDYDADMRAHLTAIIQSLVAVAHKDERAYRDLEQLVDQVWALDGQVARHAAGYRGDPQGTRARIYSVFDEADKMLMQLPSLVVAVLHERDWSSLREDAVGPTKV